MSTIALQSLKRVILPIAVLLVVIVALGLLVTKVFHDNWPLAAEGGVNRGFAGDRTESWNAVSLFFTTLANTPVIIGVTVAVAIVLRVWLGRWHEPIFLCVAVTCQALVFFFATLIIDRPRPDVPKLDESPPTSSFPSGHTSAAVALYIGLAVVLALTVRRTWLKVLCWALILVPIAVALSRLYRGMHYPSDVTASFLNGGICVLVAGRALLDRSAQWGNAQWGKQKVST